MTVESCTIILYFEYGYNMPYTSLVQSTGINLDRSCAVHVFAVKVVGAAVVVADNFCFILIDGFDFHRETEAINVAVNERPARSVSHKLVCYGVFTHKASVVKD